MRLISKGVSNVDMNGLLVLFSGVLVSADWRVVGSNSSLEKGEERTLHRGGKGNGVLDKVTLKSSFKLI